MQFDDVRGRLIVTGRAILTIHLQLKRLIVQFSKSYGYQVFKQQTILTINNYFTGTVKGNFLTEGPRYQIVLKTIPGVEDGSRLRPLPLVVEGGV